MKIDKNVWDKIFKEKGKYFETPHRDLPKIVKLLKKYKARKVLDLGCGTGRHVVYLAKNGLDVYGTDISQTAVRMTKEWLTNEKLSANIIVHDMAKKLPYTNDYFDGLVSVQVIHHGRIGMVKKIIKEIERVLKKDGLVFITVPIHSGPMTEVKKGSWTMKRIANRTYVPLDGIEKGLPHYFFKTDELKQAFNNFNIIDSYFDNTNHYCILGFKSN